MDIHLGPLLPAHRAPLSELLLATAAFSSDEVAVALELFDATYGALEQLVPGYEFAGAFDASDALLGYACFGPTPATDGTFDLYWLAVHPRAQGNGIGRTIVEAVESRLKARGVRLLIVETSSRADYAGTRNFYARQGYVEAARVRDFYAPADDRIIFTTRPDIRDCGAATR